MTTATKLTAGDLDTAFHSASSRPEVSFRVVREPTIFSVIVYVAIDGQE